MECRGRSVVEVFNNLMFLEKCDILKKHGSFVLSITYYHYTIKLYSWDRFFIEEYFENEEDEITRIKMVEGSDLEKYLHDITLSDIAWLPGFEL